jgi:putative membrane protein
MKMLPFGFALATAVSAAFAAPQLAVAQAPDLSDAEIAHVAVTANAIDIELAELARSRSRASGVSSFAERMITDHTAVNEQAAALASRLGVTPQDNAVSRSLRTDAGEARSKLSSLQAAAFDRAYMEREVAYHRAVLDALDGVLIPQADNEELRALLERVRPAIAAHLEHAREIAESLEQRRP